MPKSTEVAAELRRIADALDKEPDVEIYRPMLAFWPNNKDQFLTLGRCLPRPLQKKIDGEDTNYQKYVLENKDAAVWTHVSIDRSEVCVMVEPARPARYECPSILSAEEEAALGTF
jgi:hypothetical protein